MALVVIPPNINSAAYIAGESLPDLAAFAISDDGSGGEIFLNGQGVVAPTVTGAYDLKTIYTSAGVLFRSIPLLRAFRLLYNTPNDVAAEIQFHNFLDLDMFPVAGSNGAICGLPTITCTAGTPSGPLNVPYLHILRPSDESAVAGTWRLELRLRHSITN